MEPGTPRDRLVQSMVRCDTREFQKTLNEIGDLNSLVDADNATCKSNAVFHELTLCIVGEDKLLQMLGMIVERYKTRYEEGGDRLLKECLNQATSEDHRTPLHMATQNARLVPFTQGLVHAFITLGADPKARDINGDTVMHIAAARGIPWLLVYFHRTVGLEVDDPNARGRTPLHVAALEQQEEIAWLLSIWTKNVNVRDKEQMTPLHFAALANNYRIVKHLLMSGASRLVEDDQGMTPREFALLSKAADLALILKEPSTLTSCNPIKSPIKPVKKSLKMFVIFHLLFVLRYVLVFLFILPGVGEEFLYVSCALITVNSILYELVSNTNPGYVQPKPGCDLLVPSTQYLYRTYNAQSVCPSCESKRHSSTCHCQHCGRCVKKFDHHCPWINNCVGEGNHKIFTFFVFMLFFDFLYHCGLGAVGNSSTARLCPPPTQRERRLPRILH